MRRRTKKGLWAWVAGKQEESSFQSALGPGWIAESWGLGVGGSPRHDRFRWMRTRDSSPSSLPPALACHRPQLLLGSPSPSSATPCLRAELCLWNSLLPSVPPAGHSILASEKTSHGKGDAGEEAGPARDTAGKWQSQ